MEGSYEKDLGDDTATAVTAIELFDPDTTWAQVAVPARAGAATALLVGFVLAEHLECLRRVDNESDRFCVEVKFVFHQSYR